VTPPGALDFTSGKFLKHEGPTGMVVFLVVSPVVRHRFGIRRADVLGNPARIVRGLVVSVLGALACDGLRP